MEKMSSSTNWILRACTILALMTFILVSSEKLNSIFGSNIPIHPKLLLCFLFLCIFGLYAASIVFYRVFTFNNCEDASLELKKQIVDAKADLMSKGIKFKQR